MNQQQIKIEATQALSRLRSRLDDPKDELSTVQVMQMACDAIDKGVTGELALKSLIALWGELKLKEITGQSISELRAVVDKMSEVTIAKNLP